ncbi:hypothetical protein PIB30_087094 [Stylosanthes scabra]|uniref:Uncharacterized protein n=1 Tax=Stylosanthes scabra TaxID=79078 RepID=A0ABU6XSA8_9FABA|nr:hypothetical protein [Stylosanthes scabra]
MDALVNVTPGSTSAAKFFLSPPTIIKFEQKTFKSWQQLALHTIGTNDLEDHLHSEKIPPRFSTTAEETAGIKSAQYKQWKLKDHALMTWLLSTMKCNAPNSVTIRVSTRRQSPPKTAASFMFFIISAILFIALSFSSDRVIALNHLYSCSSPFDDCTAINGVEIRRSTCPHAPPHQAVFITFNHFSRSFRDLRIRSDRRTRLCHVLNPHRISSPFSSRPIYFP